MFPITIYCWTLKCSRKLCWFTKQSGIWLKLVQLWELWLVKNSVLPVKWADVSWSLKGEPCFSIKVWWFCVVLFFNIPLWIVTTHQIVSSVLVYLKKGLVCMCRFLPYHNALYLQRGHCDIPATGKRNLPVLNRYEIFLIILFKVSSKDEDFLDLSVDVEQNTSITHCLR